MAERFSLKDHLFNAETIGQLAREYAAALPRFDSERFTATAISGFETRELMARLEWIADCVEDHLSNDFSAMADELEAAMPPRLDPSLKDNDFGQFIHAVPGILAVRHGLEAHRERAMRLLYAATQRFSMEFYVRPFLNHWPGETLEDLHRWAEDPNYHVRRLVSEGTRPKLPWAKAVRLTPEQTLPLLDKVHADPTRYVTRSVANHLNDLSKSVPEAVLSRLDHWQHAGAQQKKELAWMTRHALRTLVKQGDASALSALGYRGDVPVSADVSLTKAAPVIGGALTFDVTITSTTQLPVLVDYRIVFARPGGRTAEKVFKLKQAVVQAEQPLTLSKSHPIKADATTFTWHSGAHRLIVQINGVDRAEIPFNLA